MTTIALIGFMGSGKTTIGELLAEAVNKSFVDLDYEIEKKFQRSIRELFDAYGEEWFRREETNQLTYWIDKNVILSTGGGIITEERNRRLLREDYLTIWLKVPFKEVQARLKNDSSRPLWNQPEESQKKLFKNRQELYEQTAHEMIDSGDASIHEILNELIRILKLYENS